MRTPWEIQCKGLWGLSLGFPSEAYSLHFTSWLTRCVAIHLELLRSFDPPFLQVLLIDRRSSLQLTFPCPAGGCCWGPGWRQAAQLPHANRRGPASPPPHRTHHSPSWGRWGSIPPAVSKQAHKVAVCFLCTIPCLWGSRGVSPLCVSMGHTAVAWVLLDTYACFEEPPNLQKPSLPLHTQVSITSIRIQRISSHRNHGLRPACGL